MSLQIEEVLYHEKSDCQDVMVLKSKTYGKVLVLDGVIQCTERDEFSYQEMIAHLPLNCHPCPKKVLVIGGGDGGVLREIVKHPLVETVDLCEIDKKVVEVSKKYLPQLACGFSSPKCNIHFADGFKFMADHRNEYDVIITDSSDPIGPASSLFEQSYYELMKKALRPNGIICNQGECVWLHLDLIKSMKNFCQKLYPVVEYCYTTIPTYPSGQIGFLICSTNPDSNLKEPVREFSREEIKKLGLRYYNSDIHRAAFVLPEFARQALED
ncbi:speE [Acanthosepion pharaonis]|uniref:SpeE n=1 Tax=Acanthosepion pharaonis TaxID=158019 RepID=A0A812ELJ7_ACAPH|nr:speE [Sepia pharaonis]